MFKEARIRLTAWYLLIILFVSLLFSITIYRTISHEINRLTRIHLPTGQVLMPRDDFSRPFDTTLLPRTPDEEFIKDAKERLIISLVIADGCILLASGILGYFLAGKTLQPIKQMLEEQNRFVSDASHELRTPLTALKTAFEVYLRDKKRTLKDADELATDSITDVDRLQALSTSLLQLAKFDTDKKMNIQTPVSIKEVTTKAIHTLQPIAKEKNITLNQKIADVTIMGDEMALESVIRIILDNAIKYSPEKSHIAITSKKAGNTAQISITDSGIGISEEDLPHIFDRFYRADASRTSGKSGGYGLGLSIAQKIVDEHNGSIEITSIEKKGTTVILEFPLG